MNRTDKQSSVGDLSKAFTENKSVLLVNFTGINVPDATELRRKIAETGSGYVVVKNRLALRAVENTSLEPVKEHFRGPTAVAFTGGDPVSLVKVLRDFIKDHPSMSFKVGIVEGKPVSGPEVEALASIPSRAQLLAKLAYLLNAPLTQFAAALQSPMRGFASVLKQLAEKKKE